MSEILDIAEFTNVIHWLEKAAFNKTRWRELGDKLGLSDNTLAAIDANQRGDVNSCFRQCLVKWLNRADGVDDVGKPSLNTLADALDKMNECKAQADYIRLLALKQKGDLSEGDSSEGKEPAKRQKIDSTTSGTGNKDRRAQASAGIEETDGPTPPQDAVNRWLEESTVELNVKRVLMHGLPGSGKTCSQRLLLNKGPPEEPVTDSTGIACRAVKATRISVNDDCMEEIDAKALLSSLAHDLKEAAAKQKKLPPEDNSTEPMEESSETKTTEPAKLADESGEATKTGDPADDIEVNKIIDEIVDTIPNAEGKFDSNWVYFIDSGGQTAFQELLPLFTRASSFNIVTLDISKGIDEKLEQKYRINGELLNQIDENSAGDSKPFLYTNIQFLKDVLFSGAILQPYQAPQPIGSEENTSTGSTTPLCPGYFVLGTHEDKKKAGVIEKYNDELKKLKLGSRKKGYFIIPAELGGNIIYPVNTLKSGPDREAEAKKLCKIIYNQVSGDEIHIPVRWFAFELTLLEKAKRKGCSFLEIKDVLHAGDSLQMNADQTKEALQYLHNATIILYYPQVLPDVVFVEPDPILNFLSRLLVLATYQIPQEHLDHFVKKTSLLYELEDDLKLRGLFTLKFLKNLKGSEDFLKFDFIRLLLHLHIINETDEEDKSEEKEYFIPSALPLCPKTSLPPKSSIDPLQIIWRSPETKRDFQILPVPRGIFPLIIVNLMKRKRQPIFCFPPKDQPDPLKYRDAMSFCVYHNQDDHPCIVHIIKKHKHIEIFCFASDSSKYCPSIREAVKEAIASSCEAIKIKPDGYEFAFACPSSTEGCYRIVTNVDEKKVKCTSPGIEPPTNSGKEQHWSWFDKTQSSTEERGLDDADGSPRNADSSDPVQANTDQKVISVSDDTTQDNTAPAPTIAKDGATSTVGAEEGQPSAQVNQPPTTGGVPAPIPPELFPKLNEIEYETELPEAVVKDIVKDIRILLMTATENELRGVLGYLKQLEGQDKIIKFQCNGKEVYIGKYGKYSVVVGWSAPTEDKQGGLEAQSVVEKILGSQALNFKPKYIVAIGICCGMKEDCVQLSDVIVSSYIINLYGMKETEERNIPRSPFPEAGEELKDFFSKRTVNFKMIKNSKNEMVQVCCGPMISYPFVLNKKDTRQKLKHEYPYALGLEMEGHAIFKAAAQHKVEAIVIKTVADWGDGNKVACKGWKDFASHAAATYVHFRMDNDSKL